MKPSLVDILACPMDKAPLTLHAQEGTDDDVEVGTLTCSECGFVYPIKDGIPNLLPPEMHDGPVTDKD